VTSVFRAAGRAFRRPECLWALNARRSRSFRLLRMSFPAIFLSLSSIVAEPYFYLSKVRPLRSGLYRLDLVIKDTLSGKIGVFNAALRVRALKDAKLDASSLILADQIEKVASSQTAPASSY